MTEQTRSLPLKLAHIMGEIGHVRKTGYNAFHQYDYVEEQVLVDAVRGRLSSEGIIVIPSVVEHEQSGTLATVLVEFKFIDGHTGESLSARIVGQGDDKGDKAFYKAYTGAVKYLLMKTFLIPTGDDPEADQTPAALKPDTSHSSVPSKVQADIDSPEARQKGKEAYFSLEAFDGAKLGDAQAASRFALWKATSMLSREIEVFEEIPAPALRQIYVHVRSTPRETLAEEYRFFHSRYMKPDEVPEAEGTEEPEARAEFLKDEDGNPKSGVML